MQSPAEIWSTLPEIPHLHRAVEVALAGHHSLCFVAHGDADTSSWAALARGLGLPYVFEVQHHTPIVPRIYRESDVIVTVLHPLPRISPYIPTVADLDRILARAEAARGKPQLFAATDPPPPLSLQQRIMEPSAYQITHYTATRLSFSPLAVQRLLAVADSIRRLADEKAEKIRLQDAMEALQYRIRDRQANQPLTEEQ